ncbi:pyruvate dehydrogenase complex dihydrolipoamide acetyltransferase [Robiginitomaculum antarcticum]|uniref:pyruvate dehydrogenase complex dihydrolipoamide acetyltransferase n=1 Tax=Robiginitomaculum antarcticum TaxID=437507 RepID=UPI00036D9A9E|nr:pyruvate dehydrogenase complex dihydrolipoamide acetyltransferase [Robiginitomaculum antarcticum]
MPIEILMPALSPTMEEGTLSKWLKKEGDTVSSGDLLAEIETDKATMEIEAVEEGTLAKILVAEGSAGVKVNAPIAILLEEDEDESALDGFETGNSGPKSNAEPAARPDESRDPSPEESSKENGAEKERAEKSLSNAESNSQPKDKEMDPVVQRGERDSDDRLKASPLAKRMAKDAGYDLSAIKGSGPHGRIVKRDIESFDGAKYAPKSADKPAPKADADAGTDVGPVRGGGANYLEKLGINPGSYDLIPLDGMRKVIAKRLVGSNLDVPDFPLVIDCEIDALLSMRKELNTQAPEGVKISVNDMLIRASALALKHYPEANASYTPDGIAYHHSADVAVAVAIDGGLITPIVRGADNKGLSTISSEMKDLASRARERKLKPQEYQGGTFSISNLGMFGIKEFGSIINEPHGMIMSVGAGEPRAVVKDGELAVATVMTVTLTCDHRVVDGAIGAQWLLVFKRYIEQPITMML